jgi:hypothetical protein
MPGRQHFPEKGRSRQISRILFVLGRAIIYLGRRLPAASGTLPATQRSRAVSDAVPPGRNGQGGSVLPPTWACWRWGLPCRTRHRARGALLPHPFTLACEPSRRAAPSAVCFLWHFPSARAGSALPTTVPCPVRTFLPIVRSGDHLAYSAVTIIACRRAERGVQLTLEACVGRCQAWEFAAAGGRCRTGRGMVYCRALVWESRSAWMAGRGWGMSSVPRDRMSVSGCLFDRKERFG